MHEKNHGETFQETQAGQQKKYLDKFRNKIKHDNDVEEEVKKVYELKKNTKPIKRQTKKEGKVKSALYELKSEIELEAVQNDSYYCCGCGISYCGLDKSHILSVSMFKHLELDSRNIQLMCRNCHMIWESRNCPDLVKLHCYWQNLEIMYELDEPSFRKELTRLEDYIVWQLDDKKRALNAEKNKLLKTLGFVREQKMD